MQVEVRMKVHSILVSDTKCDEAHVWLYTQGITPRLSTRDYEGRVKETLNHNEFFAWYVSDTMRGCLVQFSIFADSSVTLQFKLKFGGVCA